MDDSQITEWTKIASQIERLQQENSTNKGKVERLENENAYLRGLVDKLTEKPSEES